MEINVTVENDTKIMESPSYGSAVWRYLGTMSVMTFDAKEDGEAQAWSEAHPKHNFSSLQVVRTDQDGIFQVWVPLKRDNTEWEYTGRTVIYQKIKKGDYPGAATDKEVIRWFKKAERFMTDVNDEIIDAIYDTVEKETQTKEATKISSKPIITTKQYPAKKGTR